MMDKKEKIIIIGGPTCIGKSDYAVEVALRCNGEIIGADSVQVYKYLNIGSGKITTEEMKGVTHYLIDLKDPTEPFTVVDFMNEIKPIISDVISRGKIPIIVGGTGFYINALLHGYNCGHAGPNDKIREKLRSAEHFYGEGYLYDMLKKIEPDTLVRQNDLPRITRRLELYFSPYADEEEIIPQSSDVYDALLVVMDADREKLDLKAEKRISMMMDMGFLDEVKSLEKYAECRCMASVGYAEALLGLSCGMTRAEITEHMKQSYHAIIKKQQSFFRWLRWDNRVNVYNWDYTNSNKEITEFLK